MKKLDHRFNSSLVISNLKRDRRTHFKKDKDGSHRTPSRKHIPIQPLNSKTTTRRNNKFYQVKSRKS